MVIDLDGQFVTGRQMPKMVQVSQRFWIGPAVSYGFRAIVFLKRVGELLMLLGKCRVWGGTESDDQVEEDI